MFLLFPRCEDQIPYQPRGRLPMRRAAGFREGGAVTAVVGAAAVRAAAGEGVVVFGAGVGRGRGFSGADRCCGRGVEAGGGCRSCAAAGDGHRACDGSGGRGCGSERCGAVCGAAVGGIADCGWWGLRVPTGGGFRRRLRGGDKKIPVRGFGRGWSDCGADYFAAFFLS